MGCTSSKAVGLGSTLADLGATPTASADAAGFKFDKPVEWMQIHSAVRWNKNPAEVLAMLKTSDAVVGLRDPKTGNVPLHIAAQNGHLDLVKMLIEYKAVVNDQNLKGNTPLHMAVGYDYYPVVQCLLAADAQASIVNQAGHASHAGIDGDKSLGFCALVAAKNREEAVSALSQMRDSPGSIAKSEYVKTGLRLKKEIRDWPQDLFKEILTKL
jgi:hypothetical protein